MEKVTPDLDAIVVGAGFGGIQMLYELESLGLSMRLIDDGRDVGGTWQWNRYPGARTDSESWVYCYSFSKELYEGWDWSERYPSQPEVLAYLQYATERLGLRKYMQFETRVESAVFDDASSLWSVSTSRGETLTCRWLVLATGPLSRPLAPPFPGVDTFEGETYLTARWPTTPVDFTGKRVGVVGVGATGIQVVPVVARDAAHVTVFQRTPNYVIEAGNRPLTDEERQDFKDRFDEIWALANANPGGFAYEKTTTTMSDCTPDEVRAILEDGWARGGFQLLFGFSDVMLSFDSNEVLCEFIREKIRATVDDPETAELLCPRGYPFGAKRPPLGHGYYEAFNRDDVTLVDVASDPIERITPSGLRTAAREYELDVMIFGIGFDASTGALLAIDIRGRDGRSLADDWAAGPRTYLGTSIAGFPNLFMIGGPQSPFSNVPVVNDAAAQFVHRAIAFGEEREVDTLEATSEAVDEWCGEVDRMFRANVVLSQCEGDHTFFLGTNVPGKPRAPYFFFGGSAIYRERLEAVADHEFEGFAVTGARARVSS